MAAQSSSKASGGTPHKAGAFDIRTFIGSLIGIYGIVLVLTGILSTSDRDLERADGMNINLWAGIGLIVASAIFLTWARLRPVVVPSEEELEQEKKQDPADV